MFNWVTKWIKFGLLVQSGEDIVRHSYLEVMLQRYRTKWITSVHQGRMTAPELQKPALPTMKPTLNPAMKRVTFPFRLSLFGSQLLTAHYSQLLLYITTKPVKLLEQLQLRGQDSIHSPWTSSIITPKRA